MRLKQITIKNFRSIESIEGFELLDDRITTFVGTNGSGKSNILKAISYLRRGADVPSDGDFHAKDSDTDKIEIIAEFVFEDKDKEILLSNSLKPETIYGLRVIVEKHINNKPTIAFEPIGDHKED
ncbi:MAG: AAA family ATPase, partial [Candidatus Brocadiales bacterium]